MPTAPATRSRPRPRSVARRRRIATAVAAGSLAVVAFLPGDSVFGDSAPSQARTAAPTTAPVR
jgi:hypothetical protein